MGCKGSKNWDAVVHFGNNKREYSGKPLSFVELNDWVLLQFPQLVGKVVVLKANSIPLKSQADLNFFMRSADLITIVVEVVTSSVTTNLGVIKVTGKNRKILCTGFLINPQYVLIPRFCVNTHNLEDLLLDFPNGIEISLRRTEEVLDLNLHFVAVKLNEMVLDFDPISLGSESFNGTENSASLFFYLEKLPILQKYSGRFRIINETEIESELVLDNGVIGSPIISGENKLLGVYFARTKAITSKFITENLNASVKASLESFFNSKSADILYEFFTDTTCYLDCNFNKLVYYCPEETVNKIVVGIDCNAGSTAVVTSYGIVVVTSSKTVSEVFLYSKGPIKRLTSTQRGHFFHCSAYFNESVYVISGNTAAVEVYNFKNNLWTIVGNLTKPRSSATACVFNNKIYIFGGKREEKLLKSIVVYNKETFQKIQVSLPQPAFSVCCLATENKIVFFGGEVKNSKNKNSWSIDLAKEVISESSVGVMYSFGRFPVCYFESEVLFFSNDGVLFRYDPEVKKIFTMSLDEEIA